MAIDRREIERRENVKDMPHARTLGVGNCGCGKCGVVIFGMRDDNDEVMGIWYAHWTEIPAIIEDLKEKAAYAEKGEVDGYTH